MSTGGNSPKPDEHRGGRSRSMRPHQSSATGRYFFFAADLLFAPFFGTGGSSSPKPENREDSGIVVLTPG